MSQAYMHAKDLYENVMTSYTSIESKQKETSTKIPPTYIKSGKDKDKNPGPAH